ncbi:MAG: hypothetical protein K6B74_09545 [Ruminococcus sp.]|nr:hypothetical protein [Ruminococcus sp.]
MDILDAIYKDYPEIAIGVLFFPFEGRMLPYMPEFSNYQEIEENSGAEEALKTLYSALDRRNATYAPVNFNFGEKTVEIGRHRGLTTWTWTYADNDTFARDYLRGLNGMTTDFAWKTTELIESISSADVTAKDGSDIEKPIAALRSGETKALDTAELVRIEELDKDRSLMIWRYKADLTLGGESFGEYYLYSDPFVFTKETSENSEPAAVTPSEPFSAEKSANVSAAADGNSTVNADNAVSQSASDEAADNAGQASSENSSAAPAGETASENTPAANSEEAADASPKTGTDSVPTLGGIIACAFLAFFGRVKRKTEHNI